MVKIPKVLGYIDNHLIHSSMLIEFMLFQAQNFKKYIYIIFPLMQGRMSFQYARLIVKLSHKTPDQLL